ncbi:MAG: ribosome small subunit-dependent GTPase A [Firmicutes bacterium]|nr:ribosome small subunit-dependent GTPase A [Bacillota bacterium]
MGRVVQNIGGFQTILTEEGELLTCTARGRVKRARGEIVVGDLVSYVQGPQGGVIEAVEPRRNLLRRPLVANVDQAVLVFALHDPEPSLLLIDRFILGLQVVELQVLLCFNKLDLVRRQDACTLARYYESLGFTVVLTSALTHEGKRKLLSHLYGLCSVFCGPSGVGKSALINMIRPDADLITGEISPKLRRGRHTTKAARLIPLGRGGFVVDTPGYTQVDLMGLDRDALLRAFPEIAARASDCRYRSCAHLAEPECAVKEAVARGLIPTTRYNHYARFAAELAAENPWERP